VSLYVVRCYGRLDVPESIASQTVAGTWFGEPIRAVLLEASLEQKRRIERLKHVLTVELAEPGVFTDDESGAVFIGKDYRWMAQAVQGYGSNRQLAMAWQ
jgi:hypothetical protein